MSIKETEVLAEQLRVIALTLVSKSSQKILEEAADRLEDTEKIAEFYRKEAEKRKCKNEHDKIH
jgi:hypothetical protein